MAGIPKTLLLYTGGTIGMTPSDSGSTNEKSKFVQKISDIDALGERIGTTDNFKVFVTPDPSGEAHEILYEVKEFETLLDSSDMSVNEWKTIAEHIKSEYENYSAFIILHGTDTLAYTASALSFMLENLTKPVIVTGAQISLFENRSDGIENILSSLTYANCFDIKEVCVCFAHKLLRGNRTVKFSSNMMEPFMGPNCHPLGQDGIKFYVFDIHMLKQPSSEGDFNVFLDLNENVSVLSYYPTISMEAVRKIVSKPIEGVVLQGYGVGNISMREEIINILKEAINEGVIIVIITQCFQGTILSTYQSGKKLEDIGVIPGYDMTLQATLTKLCYVLGKDKNLENRRQLMKKNLCGEITLPH